MSKKLSNQFETILIISNPVSTNARLLKKHTQSIERLFPSANIIIVKTVKGGSAANKKILIKNKNYLGPKTLLCIAAGDGTVNMVIETLITDEGLSDEMKQTPILPLWGGNANDLAHMLNGPLKNSSIKQVIKTGAVEKIYPLQVEIVHENSSKIRIAACYVSIGAIANAARHINKPRHRRHKFYKKMGFRYLHEVSTVTRALLASKTFEINENGETVSMYEYAVVNGSRIAKIERLPVKITDHVFYVAKIKRKHPIAIYEALKILRQKRIGRITDTARELTVKHAAWLQMDGEVVRIHPNTHIKIQFAKKPFFAVSSR